LRFARAKKKQGGARSTHTGRARARSAYLSTHDTTPLKSSLMTLPSRCKTRLIITLVLVFFKPKKNDLLLQKKPMGV
jgi:hypothetical protein